MQIDLAGETVRLFPERALYWEQGCALFIADLHWGKAAAFRAHALPIPEAGLDDLRRLDRVIAYAQPSHLYILGDLLHAEAGRTPAMLHTFAAWRATHPALHIVLVRGNHDQHAGDPPDDWQVRCVDAPHPLPPFVLLHNPDDDPAPAGYGLAGHLHPGAVLTGAGRQSLKLPCFWFGPGGGVLPAFGGFTGTMAIRPAAGDRVYVTTDRAVIQMAPTG
jgi:DNA ligase-associated metallophosphoesterase